MEFGAESCLLAMCQRHIAWHQEQEGEGKLPEEQVVVESWHSQALICGVGHLFIDFFFLDLWVQQQSPAIQGHVRI